MSGSSTRMLAITNLKSQISIVTSEICDTRRDLFAGDHLGLSLGGNDHRLRVRVVLDSLFAVFLAETTLLHAAEWQLVIDDLRRVYPGITGLDSFGACHRAIDVASPNGRA